MKYKYKYKHQYKKQIIYTKCKYRYKSIQNTDTVKDIQKEIKFKYGRVREIQMYVTLR